MWLPILDMKTIPLIDMQRCGFYFLEIIMYSINANDNIAVKVKDENNKMIINNKESIISITAFLYRIRRQPHSTLLVKHIIATNWQ